MTADPDRKPNHLLNETSPYLEQHAYNPVDWYPWGEEAFSRARELDRPIFLSIGYSSCHWCHVMERESFEDPAIARIMNEHFVSIKVDREERPDLDAIYMTAVQMLNHGQGGWPMSVFLTPDLRPFWGGTYFPPRAVQGRPGFDQVLQQIARIYREGRERIEEAASGISEHLADDHGSMPSAEAPGENVLDALATEARRSFDPHHGGFGPAPKFPRSVDLMALLRCHHRKPDPHLLGMCEKTLTAMAEGGMYDQVGGGFHRYSTDDRWLVPHFEKMLYDNALLARVYLEGFQTTGRTDYARVAREVLDYVLREMTSPEGSFYSATDADSEGEEGKFFVWTPDEVEKILGTEDARAFSMRYGITIGGNFEGRRSLPHVAKTVEEVARALQLDPRKLEETFHRGREALYRAREERVKPFRDEKILASWNGLMISALARGAQVLDDSRYLEAAERAAKFIVDRLFVDGRLHRTHRDGRTRFPGYLDDHAYVAEAFLDLYEASFDVEYLRRARGLMDTALQRFWDPVAGAFFFTADDHEKLICRKKDLIDGATPAGNGVAALNLLRLERLTGEKTYRERAMEIFRATRDLLERVPMAMGGTILAFDFALHPPVEIVVIGEPAQPGTRALLARVHRRFIPARVLAGSASPPGEEAREVPLLAGKHLVDGKPAAFVCKGFTCLAPATDPGRLDEILARG
jgi:uncharacterized protein